MNHPENIMDQQYADFIRTVALNRTVYTLKLKNNPAVCGSTSFEDADHQPLPVACVWSDKASAESCKIEEWEMYRVDTIKLADFLENWCVGMFMDTVLMGINFNPQLEGVETNPLQVLLDILNEMNLEESTLRFKKFRNILELQALAQQELENLTNEA